MSRRLYVDTETGGHSTTYLTVSTLLGQSRFPDAGHLVHMATHIDVLVGDYESCVRYNLAALRADQSIMRISPDTAGPESFYFVSDISGQQCGQLSGSKGICNISRNRDT